MNKKNRSMPMVLGAALALMLTTLPLGAQVATPKAEITSFSLERVGLRDLDFKFDLTVNNPYPVNLSFSGMTLDFAVEGTPVFTTASQGGFTVAARKTATNSFVVTLAYENIIKLVKNYLDKEWLDTVVSGKLTIPLPRLPGLPRDISFDYRLTQKIPAIKPVVEIRGFIVSPPTEAQVAAALKAAAKNIPPGEAVGFFRNLAQGKAPARPPFNPQDIDVPFTVTYTLAIRNEGKTALGFSALDYRLAIDGQDLVQGKSTQVRQEGATTLVTISNEFSSKNLSGAIQNMLQARRGSFRISGRADLVLPPEVRRTPAPLSFDEAGTFSF